jgi:hypothetical protein
LEEITLILKIENMKKLNEIGIDKYLHVVACFVIAAIVAWVSKSLWNGDEPIIFVNSVCGFIGVIGGMIVGLAKEVLYDWLYKGGKVDGGDLLADFIGCMIAFGFAFLM